MKVAGIVLCGGRSSRMGRPKAWLPWGDEIMLARVVRLLGEVVGPVIVVAGPDQEIPPLPGAVDVVRDAVAGRGPLQGLAAGLDALKGRAEAAYLSSCDVPLLRPAFVRLLIDLLGDQAICVPDAAGYHQPLAAVYRLTVAPAVQRLLAEGRGRMGLLFERVQTRFVEADALRTVDPQLQSLRNVNTPDEYEAALTDCKHFPTRVGESGESA